MHRRQFLGTVTAAGLGGLGLAACSRPDAAGAGGRGLERIGVQLYTVRDRMREDVAGTLRTVGQIGYAEVETAGYFDYTPVEFRQMLDDAGLIAPAAHVPIIELREDLDRLLSAAQTIGHSWLIVPWLDGSERTAEGYQRVAADLNHAAETASGHGVRVAYHNHEWEFDPIDGERSGYDILLAETDPALVDMELDLFWAVQAGQDPVALFEQHPGRFRLCHVKDMADPQGAQQMVEVGTGDIDFARIFGHADRAGLRHYFVEHDNPDNPIESIRTSYENLRQLTF